MSVHVQIQSRGLTSCTCYYKAYVICSSVYMYVCELSKWYPISPAVLLQTTFDLYPQIYCFFSSQDQNEKALDDINKLLALSPTRSSLGKLLMRKTQALSKLHKTQEAYETAKQWTSAEPKVWLICNFVYLFCFVLFYSRYYSVHVPVHVASIVVVSDIYYVIDFVNKWSKL